jgi:EAL domain
LPNAASPGFVQNRCGDRLDAAIVRATIALSRSFDLSVIAEGIDSDAQRRRLLANGCEEVQGYLFGRPTPASVFAEGFGLRDNQVDQATSASGIGERWPSQRSRMLSCLCNARESNTTVTDSRAPELSEALLRVADLFRL